MTIVFGQGQEANTTAASSTRASIQSSFCIQPTNAVNKWYYKSYSNGPYGCEAIDSSAPWMMLSAYRAGGQENVHWKYTNDVNDPACITSWLYYASDGNTIQSLNVRTTTVGGHRWCPLPVYRQGGVQGKQWAYCECSGAIW